MQKFETNINKSNIIIRRRIIILILELLFPLSIFAVGPILSVFIGMNLQPKAGTIIIFIILISFIVFGWYIGYFNKFRNYLKGVIKSFIINEDHDCPLKIS
jgi:hypothetical protein